jgi:signal transduction histidine kinase
VIFAAIKLDRLTQAARDVPLPESAIVTIIDTTGHILARIPGENEWIGKAFPDSELVREVLKRREGVIETVGLDRKQRVYAITPISDDISPRLFVAVGVPTSILFAEANRTLRRNLIVMFSTIIAALLGAGLFAHRALVGPVQSLSDAAGQLARGNLAARSHVSHSTLEISQLSDAFNSMASSLQEREAELRKAHADIARINADLENRVNERTAQLTAANQELESFSYSVSHDLRAPLRHMDGFAELLKKNQSDRLDEKGRRHLQIISDAARKMGALIDDLLIFSRMARQEMSHEVVNMSELVTDAIAQHESETANRKIEWNISPLPTVQGDRAMLKQVWVNLVSNALKYSRTREVARIDIRCDEHPAEFVFSIRDNGVGFDMRYADKLFGVFQRLHREEEFEGTGVGLANIRRIVMRHGGRTWAESTPDQGATFYFSILKHA